MPDVASNKVFLTSLFSGPFPGHAVVVTPSMPPSLPAEPTIGTASFTERIVEIERRYVAWASFQEHVGDDSVPFPNLHTSTGLFAAAFGARIVEFDDSNPASRPLFETAAEAETLVVPDVWDTCLGRHLELVAAVRERVGHDVSISGPDMQSPLGLAAQLWEKAAFMAAMVDHLEIVCELVAKCHTLIKQYLTELRRIAPNMNPIHCPLIWAPAKLGVSVSEDEVGSISRRMYEAVGLWTLVDLSESFGGLFMHCCAAADHQYPAFQKIPNLRGLNRVYQAPGPVPALRSFGDKTVHMVAWQSVEEIRKYLDFDVSGVRFAFCLSADTVDDAKRQLDTVKGWCPRV